VLCLLLFSDTFDKYFGLVRNQQEKKAMKLEKKLKNLKSKVRLKKFIEKYSF